MFDVSASVFCTGPVGTVASDGFAWFIRDLDDVRCRMSRARKVQTMIMVVLVCSGVLCVTQGGGLVWLRIRESAALAGASPLWVIFRAREPSTWASWVAEHTGG